VQAEVLILGGRFNDAGSALEQAERYATRSGEKAYFGEIYRHRAGLHLADANVAEAERMFLRTVEFSEQLDRKWRSLQAAIGLAKIWRQQGKADEGRLLLDSTYTWFTEGFDTTTLREARSLLAEMR
jgi:predicted ATPase